MNNKPIIIVAGEPNSIFSEILFKSLKEYTPKNPIILIISYQLLIKQLNILKIKPTINLLNDKKIDLKKINLKKINVIDLKYEFKKPFEKITNRSKLYISKSFKIALELIKNNKTLGLINGPVSKSHFLRGKYLGVTEYLASKNNKKNNIAMLIYHKNLSVSPITTHLSLKLVHRSLDKKKIVNHVKLIHNFYINRFKINPRIAITGLNPHCESNFKSSEEKKIIIPAIKSLVKKKIKVKGPFSADTIFMKDNYKKYNIIIGMYHDQVLTPIKTIFGFKAINITLGLPFIRISPDHGPNISMLGKNLSNPESLIEAIKFLDKKSDN